MLDVADDSFTAAAVVILVLAGIEVVIILTGISMAEVVIEVGVGMYWRDEAENRS